MSIPFETSYNRQAGAFGTASRSSQTLRHQRRVVVLVGGILGASSLIGVAMNRGLTPRTPVAAAASPAENETSAEFALEAARRESVDATPVAAPVAAVPAVETAVRHTSVQRLPDLRFSDITPPENPFRPVAAPATPASALPSFAGAPTLPPVFSAPAPGTEEGASNFAPAPKSTRPAPRPAAPEASGPKAEELAVTGIIQGDPAIAVVRHGGQSLFLKIGDQVADTWRLVAIGERSATFQNGEQRVEIPIKGGNS